MSKNPLKLKIAYLYPDFLQGFCDKANLDVFKLRAHERNIDVEIEEIKNNDKINSSKYDFLYISGNNIEMLDLCNKHLKNNYTQLRFLAENNIPMLAINCGYILFGKCYQLNNSPIQYTLGILNTSTIMAEDQVFSKVIGEYEMLRGRKEIAGYIQCATHTVLEEDVKPFLYTKKDKTEGAVYNNVIGTYITSPILAQNPHFCDYLIARCLNIKYKCTIPLTKLCDDIEWYSHNYLLEAK